MQAAKPPPSTLHAKLAGAPVAVNAIESVVVLIVAGTEVVMLVDGGVVSTVKLAVAGVGSVFRRRRSHVTEKV